MSKKKKQKHKIPAPRAAPPPGLPALRGPDPSVAPDAVAALVQLQQEVCRASGRNTFDVWQDWLGTMAPWLEVVGQMGELNAAAALPPRVQQLYTALEDKYTAIAVKYPAAVRVMSENFTQMWQILNHLHPRVTRFDSPPHWDANPDILGQAFLASLDYPDTWTPFFPSWPAALTMARQLIHEDAPQQVYHELAVAHIRANAEYQGRITAPIPGDDESWTEWLKTILPYADLPHVISVMAVTLLPALTTRFTPWLMTSDLVRFVWPRLEKDPTLNNIISINAMLAGLNGFHLGRQFGNAVALEHLRQTIENEMAQPAAPSPPPPPAALPPRDEAGARPPRPEVTFSDQWRPK